MLKAEREEKKIKRLFQTVRALCILFLIFGSVMGNEPKITVDVKQVEDFGFQFQQMAQEGLRTTAETGEALLYEEVPKVTTNLAQGVSHSIDYPNLRAELSISAVSRQVGDEGGLLHLPSGKTREISLRGRPAFNYAEAVARGTGVYGPRGAPIRPVSAKGLLIPVSSPPTRDGKPESYITSGGQAYIVRRSIKGRRPNPFDERAAKRLEEKIPAIWDAVVEAFANQEQQSQ